MARILDFFLKTANNTACDAFPSPLLLYEGLKREDSAAIRCLLSKISGAVLSIGKAQQLNEEDIEELTCDCICLCIQKIKDGRYQFQGFSPATYAIEIAKNKARNYQRSALKNQTVSLDKLQDVADEPNFTNLENCKILENLLAKLDENCRNLIRLKYLEERSDKEQIEQHLTQYSTVDSLKNNRARCMKKLVELARM